MVGKTKQEKRRFWIFLIVIVVVLGAGERLSKLPFFDASPDIVYEEFNRRCLANLGEFDVLDDVEELRPYRLDSEGMREAVDGLDTKTWRYEHKDNGNVEVVLTVVENQMCGIQFDGVDFADGKKALLEHLLLLPAQYTEGHENVEEYLLEPSSEDSADVRVAIRGSEKEDRILVLVAIDDSRDSAYSRVGAALYGTPPEDLLYREFVRRCVDNIEHWDRILADPALVGSEMPKEEMLRTGPDSLHGWVYSVPPFKQTTISLMLTTEGVCLVHSSGEHLHANIRSLQKNFDITELAVAMPIEGSHAFRIKGNELPGKFAFVMTVPGEIRDTGEPTLTMSIQSEQRFKEAEGISVSEVAARPVD